MTEPQSVKPVTQETEPIPIPRSNGWKAQAVPSGFTIIGPNGSHLFIDLGAWDGMTHRLNATRPWGGWREKPNA